MRVKRRSLGCVVNCNHNNVTNVSFCRCILSHQQLSHHPHTEYHNAVLLESVQLHAAVSLAFSLGVM